MTKKFVLNFIALSFYMIALNANASFLQHDSLSVAEMKAMFYQRYENGMKPKSLDNYDLLRWSINSKDPMNFCYLVNNKILKKPKGMELPTSEYVLQGDTLCWVIPRQTLALKQFKKLIQKLQNKYGKIPVNDTLTIIPAKWMTGQIEFLSWYPEEYATTYFSTQAFRRNVINGVVKENTGIRMDLGYSSLDRDVRFIVRGNNGYHSNGQHIYIISGKFNTSKEKIMQDRKLRDKQLLILFARDINRICPRAPKDYDYTNPQIYSMLLYFDAQRYVHVEVLLPKQTDEKDQFMLSNLRKAIESQPAGLFESHFTIDGKIFPGLYVKAYYGGLGWNLFDYRALDEE